MSEAIQCQEVVIATLKSYHEIMILHAFTTRWYICAALIFTVKEISSYSRLSYVRENYVKPEWNDEAYYEIMAITV